MKPLTKHQLDTYESAFDLARGGLLFMPQDIASRNACAVLAKRRMLEPVLAVHENSATGSEGCAYRLSLRPALAAVVRLFNGTGYRHLVKQTVRGWQRDMYDGHTVYHSIRMASDINGIGLAYLALWHAQEAARARDRRDERHCCAHLMTVRAIAATHGVT